MAGCCAFGCTNSRQKGFKLYCIPCGKHDELRRRIWLTRIRRKDFSAPKGSSLCQVHFDESQFEKYVPGKLKPNAVPTIFSHKTYITEPKRKLPAKHKKVDEPSHTDQIRIVKVDHSYSDSFSDKPLDTHIQDSPCSADTDDVPTVINEVLNIQNYSTAHPSWDDFNKLKSYLKSVQRKLRLALKAKETLEKNIAGLFNPDQIQFLEKNSNIISHWSDDTVKRALELRSACGSSGYSTLLSQGFPLPSERTLRRKIQNGPVNIEMLSEVI